MRTDATNAVVAANVRAEMARVGVAQSAIAQTLGLSLNAVSRRLRGLTPWSVAELVAVAARLDVPISDLLPRDERQPVEAGAA